MCLGRLRRQRRPICRRQVSAVVLQIGSNDLTDDRYSVQQFVADCWAYIEYLQTRCRVQRVVIMEILHRKEGSRYRINMTIEDYNRKVDDANAELKRICSTSSSVVFWRHIWHVRRPGTICRDGVHLNWTALKNYWRSVRGALMRGMRAWLWLYNNKTAQLSQRRPRDAPNICVPWKLLRVLTTHPAILFQKFIIDFCSDRY